MLVDKGDRRLNDETQPAEDQLGEEQEPPMVQRVAEKVRADSAKVQFTAKVDFSKEPFDLADEAFDEVMAELAVGEEYKDVTTIVEDGEIVYLYSSDLISRNYAGLLARGLRNDPVRMIADTVREESELYPRPTPLAVFRVPPFSLGEDEAEQAHRELLERPEYTDIHQVEASTGAIYLFSDCSSLTEPIVNSMVEWEEVGRFDNP
jgi:hypothetical protein